MLTFSLRSLILLQVQNAFFPLSPGIMSFIFNRLFYAVLPWTVVVENGSDHSQAEHIPVVKSQQQGKTGLILLLSKAQRLMHNYA